MLTAKIHHKAREKAFFEQWIKYAVRREVMQKYIFTFTSCKSRPFLKEGHSAVPVSCGEERII